MQAGILGGDIPQCKQAYLVGIYLNASRHTWWGYAGNKAISQVAFSGSTMLSN
jgi:hypothetical protein